MLEMIWTITTFFEFIAPSLVFEFLLLVPQFTTVQASFQVNSLESTKIKA